MTTPTNNDVTFICDAQGNRTSVILTISRYEQLIQYEQLIENLTKQLGTTGANNLGNTARDSKQDTDQEVAASSALPGQIAHQTAHSSGLNELIQSETLQIAGQAENELTTANGNTNVKKRKLSLVADINPNEEEDKGRANTNFIKVKNKTKHKSGAKDSASSTDSSSVFTLDDPDLIDQKSEDQEYIVTKRGKYRKLYFSSRNSGVGSYNATGYVLPDHGKNYFVILHGTKINHQVANSLRDNVKKTRDRLINEKVLVSTDYNYQFTKDVAFNSSSIAASLVAGSNRSGPEAWKDNMNVHVIGEIYDSPDKAKKAGKKSQAANEDNVVANNSGKASPED